MRKREGFRSPVREYRTPGSLAGLAGDCQSYATCSMVVRKEESPLVLSGANYVK
jgi:hypothetical protein